MKDGVTERIISISQLTYKFAICGKLIYRFPDRLIADLSMIVKDFPAHANSRSP